MGWRLGVSEGRERGKGAGQLGGSRFRDANVHVHRPGLASVLT